MPLTVSFLLFSMPPQKHHFCTYALRRKLHDMLCTIKYDKTCSDIYQNKYYNSPLPHLRRKALRGTQPCEL